MAEPKLQATPTAPPAPDQGLSDALPDALAAMRALGAPQRQPLRYSYLQALARRAQAHSGAARQLLDARLQRALQDCQALLDAPAPAAALHPAPAAAAPVTATASAPAKPVAALAAATTAESDPAPSVSQPTSPLAMASASPLSGLLAALRAEPCDQAQTPAQDQPGQAPQDLKVLRHFRASWARQRLDQQLDHSLTRVPDNAGPLNTQRLLLQALGVMRALSPDYLQHLMAQVEALRWIEQAGVAEAAAALPARRGPADRTRKPTRA